MDGWITIGTDVDSQEFDVEIKRLEKESKRWAKEQEKLLKTKAKLEIDYKKYESDLDKIKQDYLEFARTCTDNSLKLTMQNEGDKQIASLNEKYKNTFIELNKVNSALKECSVHQTEVNSKLQEMEAKSLGLHMNFDKIGGSLMNNVKKVGKWLMAVFSLRSAYNAVKQVMSTLSQYNDDLANKLNSIKLVFASALEPIITRVVDLVYRLMVYMNYISKAWFGVDLFASASAKSMAKASKSVKEMRKDLFGFDEANIRNDNGSTGVANAGGSFDFVEPKDVSIPSWIKWIADNKDTVLGFLKQAGVLIVGLKLAQLLGFISNIGKKLSNLVGLLGNMSGLQIFVLITGIVVTLTGIVTLIQGIISFVKDPSWSNFNTILAGLTLTILGVAAAMIALNATNPIGWITLAIGLGVGLVTAVSNITKALFDNKAQILDTKEAQEQLTEAQNRAKNATNDYVSAVDNAESAQKRLEEAEKRHKISGEELWKSVQNGTLDYKNMTDAQKEVYKAYLNNQDAQEKLKTSTEELTKAKEEEKKASWENQIAIADETGNYEDFRDAVVKAYEDGELSAGEAREIIERCMSDMSNDTRKTFTQDLPNAISEGLNPKKYESFGTKLKKWFSGLWKSIWGSQPSTAGTIKVSYSGNGGAVGSGIGSYHAKGAIITYPKIKYHANGAIINQPGRGVPLVDHRGGERGQEGILPLTDSQQMDLLGSTIAKYLSINATIPIYMGNRQVARELKKIEVNRDFAANR